MILILNVQSTDCQLITSILNHCWFCSWFDLDHVQWAVFSCDVPWEDILGAAARWLLLSRCPQGVGCLTMFRFWGKGQASLLAPHASFLFVLNGISWSEHKICLTNSCLGSSCNHLSWILVFQTKKGETSSPSSKAKLILAKKAVSESDSQVDLKPQTNQRKRPLVHFPA